MRWNEVNKETFSTTCGCEKEDNELYRNVNKITDAVNNSLITTMTASEVFKTQCMAYEL